MPFLAARLAVLRRIYAKGAFGYWGDPQKKKHRGVRWLIWARTSGGIR